MMATLVESIIGQIFLLVFFIIVVKPLTGDFSYVASYGGGGANIQLSYIIL